MRRWRVRTATSPLRGEVCVPGDKSIGHRALIFASLAEGACTLRGLSGGLDNRATAAALAAMGVVIERDGATARVGGVGLRGLRAPAVDLDCGNSGTTMRLLAGLLVGQPFGARLVGDASLSRRPMKRIVEPLRARGAHLAGTVRLESQDLFAPLTSEPLRDGERLIGLEHEMGVASAQVKTSLLLSGLYARGLTAIREPVLSRDHTERMLRALGVPLERAGSMVVLDPSEWRGGWDPFEWDIPGDPSSAAFFVAAAQLVPRSVVTVKSVCVNPTRTGFFDVLRAMGSSTYLLPQGDAAGDEPLADVIVDRSAALTGARTGGELLTRMIDEVPAFAAMAAGARGRTEIRDAEELRVKESDRLAAMATVLRAFGVPCDELEDGLRIEGGGRLRAAHVQSEGDHRIAMAAAVLGLRAEGETIVDDVDCVDTSFPGFAATLRALGADVVEERLEGASPSGVTLSSREAS
jgi:3-phosphoshikimate 1-carboxyvinyltransferase